MAPGSRDRLQREVDALDALAAVIKQDRGISISYRNVLLNSHVAGQGFLEGHNDANSQDQTLFVNGEDNGDEADSAYEEEETAANDDEDDTDMEDENDHLSWLNGLAPYIVSNGHCPTNCHSYALTDCSCTARAPWTTEAWLPHAMPPSRY
jgi:U3 small nucleolar RNA-associated protein 14